MKRKKLALRCALATVFALLTVIAGVLWVLSLSLYMTSLVMMKLLDKGVSRCSNIGRVS